MDMMTNALRTAEILLPRPGIDLSKWAVVACDQFTAQPEYWQAVEEYVGDAPSTLRVTLPEVWLNEAETRIPAIHTAMREYLDGGLWQTAVKQGFVLVCRETESGVRPGLLVSLDLEQYDFTPGAESLIRPTEGTVVSRVPPRARIRAGAPVELPHVMMLIDDPGRTVIEPLLEKADTLRPLYDFALMQRGGHVRGWAVEGRLVDEVHDAVEALRENCGGLLYAVGDGNHSLAAARQCWLDLREKLSPAVRAVHPARFALVELVNLNCPALVFEPIHRAVFNVDAEALMREYRSCLTAPTPGGSSLSSIRSACSRRSWTTIWPATPRPPSTTSTARTPCAPWCSGTTPWASCPAPSTRPSCSATSAAGAYFRERPSPWARPTRSGTIWRRDASYKVCKMRIFPLTLPPPGATMNLKSLVKMEAGPGGQTVCAANTIPDRSGSYRAF